MLITVFKVIFVQFQVLMTKYAKRGNLEHSRAILGQEWIAYGARWMDEFGVQKRLGLC